MNFCLTRMTLLAQIIVSGTLAFAFIGSIAALFLFAWYGVDVPTGTKEALLILIGVLAREFADMCGHWLFDRAQPNEDSSAS